MTDALHPQDQLPDRDFWPAVRAGLMCRCPACGEGALFARYLRVADQCPSCGTALHHHRADDGPAYLTILIVAHIVGLALLPMIEAGMAPLSVTLILCGIAVVASLALLPRMKGMIVAIQWAKRMHGFGRPGA